MFKRYLFVFSLLIAVFLVIISVTTACPKPEPALPPPAPSSPPPLPSPPPPPPPPPPAAFTLANLSISPAEVKPGDKVTITAEVRNIGGSAGSYTVELRVNDVVEASRLVTLAAKTSQLVSFTLSKDLPGTYKVNLAELSGKFLVTAPASAVRTATLTDEQATRLLVRAITVGKVEFMPGNIIRLSWPPLLHLSLPIDVSEGKLYFTANVPEWVYRELHMIHYYTKFDKGRLFLTALPCWFDPRKEIAPDVDKLPYVISIVTRKGEATITYRWP